MSKKKNELVQLIRKWISSTGNPISFLWIVTHIGISMNEKADANESIRHIRIQNIVSETSQNNLNYVQLFNKRLMFDVKSRTIHFYIKTK